MFRQWPLLLLAVLSIQHVAGQTGEIRVCCASPHSPQGLALHHTSCCFLCWYFAYLLMLMLSCLAQLSMRQVIGDSKHFNKSASKHSWSLLSLSRSNCHLTMCTKFFTLSGSMLIHSVEHPVALVAELLSSHASRTPHTAQVPIAICMADIANTAHDENTMHLPLSKSHSDAPNLQMHLLSTLPC